MLLKEKLKLASPLAREFEIAFLKSMFTKPTEIEYV